MLESRREKKQRQTRKRLHFGNERRRCPDAAFFFAAAARSLARLAFFLRPRPRPRPLSSSLLPPSSRSSFAHRSLVASSINDPKTTQKTPTGVQGLRLRLAQDQDRADAYHQARARAGRGREQEGQPCCREEGQGRGRVRAVLGGRFRSAFFVFFLFFL